MNQEALADYYVADRKELVAFARTHGPFCNALDIGCASGVFGESLVSAGVVSSCDGIEPFADAVAIAKTRLRRAWHGTLESMAEIVPWADYDLISMADVLEHLADPWMALRQLHEHTAADCRLLLSVPNVPNVRHYKVSLPLLFKGEFRYTNQGIMDRTHLHFFTRKSLAETLQECGWQVRAIGSNMKRRYRKAYMPTSWLEPFVAVQYLVIAEKQ
jgi:2-polyprenyl-3-methyl-5-hydroxy-6-metoxy-1,4-benzoquinol methylase